MTAQSPARAFLRGARLVAVGVVLQAMLAHGAQAALNQEEAREVEALLARLNFDPGPVDGVIDERTRAAVTLYQQFAALPEDGEPNEALLAELRGVAGAFGDLKAQRESQSGADAGVDGMQTEAVPEPEAEPEAEPETEAEREPDLVTDPPADPPTDPPADSATDPAPAAEAEVSPAETPTDSLPGPLADDLGDPDSAVPVAEAEDAAENAKEVTAPETPKEPAPAAEKATAVPPQPEEPKPKASGFSIRSVLAKLLGSDEEEPKVEPPPEVAPPAEPVAEPVAEPDAAAAPTEIPDPTERIVASDAAVDSETAGDVQTASLARGGYAAFGAAHAAARDNSLDRAIAAYTVALRSDDLAPEHAALALYNRADALYRLRRYEEAIVDYDAAIAKDPSFADAYYNRGYAYQASGDRRRAIADFRKARELGLQRVGDRAPSAPPPLP